MNFQADITKSIFDWRKGGGGGQQKPGERGFGVWCWDLLNPANPSVGNIGDQPIYLDNGEASPHCN